MSWDKKVSSLRDYALSAPTWYARRAIVADTAAVNVEGSKYNFRALAAQFEAGDKLVVIAYNADGKLAEDAERVEIESREGFEYTLTAALPAGKVMLVKLFGAKVPPVENNGYYLIPVTREMVTKGTDLGDELAKMGIVSPGWYRWRRIVDAEGKVVHTTAQLAVSMKTFTNKDAGIDGEFNLDDAANAMRFDPIEGTDEGGVKLI